jgi:hypothetical protein
MPIASKTRKYLTLGLPLGVLERIHAAAANDHRSASNWATLLILRELERVEGGKEKK